MRTLTVSNTLDLSLRYFLPLLLLPLFACSQPQESLDFLLTGGQLIDGESSEVYQYDIGINADTIAFIGDAKQMNITATRIIDVSGFYVTPGFIDPHTHALQDLSDSVRNANLNYLLQGVTTVVTGSDGNSVNDIEERLAEWETNGIGTNAAIMVGHRNIRQLIMGMDARPPTEEEMANLKTMVERGMEAGALGFSTGLYYSPASFSTTEEVVELAKVAASYGGIYDAHIRDESSYNIGLLAAIDESIQIAEEAQIPVNISHIKCLGVDVWGLSSRITDTIAAARNNGLQITADQYPYQASGTHLGRALLPKWVFADFEDYSLKLEDPELLPRIKEAITDNMRRRGGAASLLIVFAAIDSLNGYNLEEIAHDWEMAPIDAAIEIMKNGDAAVASFNMNENDIHHFMQQDWVMTCSDGTVAHPRKFGSFTKKIREYVIEKEVIDLTQMVRSSSGLTAETFQIPNRGKLKVGFFADLLVFRPEEAKDNATFEDPAVLSSGFKYIFLNGLPVVEEGAFTNQLYGRVIRKPH